MANKESDRRYMLIIIFNQNKNEEGEKQINKLKKIIHLNEKFYL